MCIPKLSVRPNVTPWYITWVDHGIKVSLIDICGRLLVRFRLNRMAMVLDAFIRRRHFLNQTDVCCSCLCNWIIAMFALWLLVRYIVSSAKRATDALLLTGMSFVKMRYKVGARQEPCGTPAWISRREDSLSSIRTRKDLFERKD